MNNPPASNAPADETQPAFASYLQRSGSSWVFYGSSPDDLVKIRREVDAIFAHYFFYPEIEWGKYGYRAPDPYQVLGAWRHPQTRAIAFLLDNPHMMPVSTTSQVLLYIVGDDSEIAAMAPRCHALKARFAAIALKGERGYALDARLARIQQSKSLGVLATLLTVVAAVVNGFSSYLRTLPPPQFRTPFGQEAYAILLSAVYFASVITLLIVVVLIGVFLTLYGAVVIRRL